MPRLSTGIRPVDDLIGGVRLGDNLVVEVDEGGNVDPFVTSFLRSCRLSRLLYVSFHVSPFGVLSRAGEAWDDERFILVDCFTEGLGAGDETFARFYRSRRARDLQLIRVERPVDPTSVQAELSRLERELGRGARYLFDSVTGMQRLWGAEAALDAFLRTCPRLFDLRTVAYWVLERPAHDLAFLSQLAHATQVALSLSGNGEGQLVQVLKAEGRSPNTVGQTLRLRFEDGKVRAIRDSKEERVRLGQVLRARREVQGLSQSELARLIGVSPSALSQAERGTAGLSGATLAKAWRALGLPVTGDESEIGSVTGVSRQGSRPEQLIASGLSAEQLAETPAGARALVLRFAPHAKGTGSPFPTKRDEVAFLISGRLKIRVGFDELELGPGDAIALLDEPVRGWENSTGEEARLLWVIA
jgi:transcriptional regulator with XRE-family HTH domain